MPGSGKPSKGNVQGECELELGDAVQLSTGGEGGSWEVKKFEAPIDHLLANGVTLPLTLSFLISRMGPSQACSEMAQGAWSRGCSL